MNLGDDERNEERAKLVLAADEERAGVNVDRIDSETNARIQQGGETDDGAAANDDHFLDERPCGDDEHDELGNDVEEEEEQSALTLSSQSHSRVFLQCALPDNCFQIYGVKLLDGPFALKLFKFLLITFAGISLMHWFVRRMAWEHRETFTLEDFWTYESTSVVVDALFFFTVARLHQQRGVDHLAWILVAFAGSFYASFITTFRFLRQSFTLYAMHCTWSWKLWLFVLILIPLIVTTILLHVRYAVRRGEFVMKFIELILSVLFLLLPSASSPFMHLHHWFAGWLLGMHANFDVWWSRATLAWCWGLYINGIAVYGRDPLLTCGYTLFLSKQQGCPYLDCYLDGLSTPPSEDIPPVKEMKTPDWKNCSADAYHP